jgi:hypothetical protein
VSCSGMGHVYAIPLPRAARIVSRTTRHSHGFAQGASTAVGETRLTVHLWARSRGGDGRSAKGVVGVVGVGIGRRTLKLAAGQGLGCGMVSGPARGVTVVMLTFSARIIR